MIQWYAVHTQPMAEEKARFNLENQGFTVYVPRFLKKRRHARRVDWVKSPLFPRYLFVAMDTAKARWRAINSTLGVAYLVGNNETAPLPVPEVIIDGIRAREGDDGLVSLETHPGFKPGEELRITEGPFADHVGLFDGTDEKKRILILLSVMGRQVRLKLSEEMIGQPA
ncbi:transcription termination/antitermination protein NusG [Magnetospira sp. QH-2]|uniref:transcription termination/antitermination protein NusG n=1 Tax=Magnetospira sp. (strain QH-2) TaxID=1288970 RepID=UPI0003E80B1A|nr:transcriptional activator RfaH [Magnetospira sp. QH-2]CCQ75522.1 putative Transcriptional antitermination protein [Magnetospira sp. QH-2]